MSVRNISVALGMLGGYMGKILRVDLTLGKISEEPLTEEMARKYVGSYGIGGRILYDEVPPWVGPLDPANRLIFTTGPVTGAITQTAGRFTVVTKSPQTGYFGDASGGGFWGPELKFSGYDHVVVQGRASKPVYIWINDGSVEIRDAGSYWGMDCREVDRALRRDLGDKKTQVACTGPAGENLVRYAAILHDDAGRAAGRCGVGAVMGFMNLKAVTVRGHREVPVANIEALREVTREITLLYRSEGTQEFHRGGTPGSAFASGWEQGDTMSYNWQNEYFRGYDPEKISWPGGFEKVLAGTRTCYGCAIACRRVSNAGPAGPYQIEQGMEGIEYENMTMLGCNCGIDDIWALNKANDLCNLYGLDTISAGSTIAFAMECYERGLIDKKDTDGVELRFGNGDAVIEMLGKIARREGFGNILAEGSRRAAQIIGKGSEKYAMQVKGMEIAAHDPRPYGGEGVMYATTVTGGRHTEGLMRGYEDSGVPLLGIPKSDHRTTEHKGSVAKITQDWWCMINTMGWCLFTDGHYNRGGKEDNFIRVYNAVTGLDIGIQDGLLIGERIFNLRKAFNMRHGCTRAEDTLPERLLKEPNMRGGGAVVKLDQILPDFYEARGWDPETSRPTKAKLNELGLDDIAKDFWV